MHIHVSYWRISLKHHSSQESKNTTERTACMRKCHTNILFQTILLSNNKQERLELDLIINNVLLSAQLSNANNSHSMNAFCFKANQ